MNIQLTFTLTDDQVANIKKLLAASDGTADATDDRVIQQVTTITQNTVSGLAWDAAIFVSKP